MHRQSIAHFGKNTIEAIVPDVVPPPPKDITRMLRSWQQGDQAALGELLPVIYEELRGLARRSLRGERADHSLQATALVHEAFLRLVRQEGSNFSDRAHFFGAAARLMRQILVDHARARLAEKRGGGVVRVTFDGEEAVESDEALIALDEALTALAAEDPQQARLVELRYFSGLTIEETAVLLQTSPATVKRSWATARAWLRREIRRSTPTSA